METGESEAVNGGAVAQLPLRVLTNSRRKESPKLALEELIISYYFGVGKSSRD